MYKIIDDSRNTYVQYEYASENEFERMIVAHAAEAFGRNGIYFDIKKRIGKAKQGAAIPDGYYLDLMFHEKPRLYFFEVEMSDHDIYGHIASQIVRFKLSSDTSKHKIKTILINEINADPEKKSKLDAFFTQSKYNNVNELLDKLIFDDEVSVIIVINEETDELNAALAALNVTTTVLRRRHTFVGRRRCIVSHRFRMRSRLICPRTRIMMSWTPLLFPPARTGSKANLLAITNGLRFGLPAVCSIRSSILRYTK